MYLLFVALAAAAYAVVETLLYCFKQSVFASLNERIWKPERPDHRRAFNFRFKAITWFRWANLSLLMLAMGLAQFPFWQLKNTNTLGNMIASTFLYVIVYNIVCRKLVKQKPHTNEKQTK